MAKTANTTLLEDLIDPEVIADLVDEKLIDAIRLAPLATIDNTLVGRDGDTLSFPSYEYVGMAEDVEEGTEIPISKLQQDAEKVTVTKIGRAIEFSDEALLSGNGNDIGIESTKQVVVAINDKVEKMWMDEMKTKAALTYNGSGAADAATAIAEALQAFGEDIDGEKVALVPPSFYGKLLNSKYWVPNSDANADVIIRGSVGQVFGTQIVLSNRCVERSYSLTSDTSVQNKIYYKKKGTASYVKVKNIDPSADPQALGYYEAGAKTEFAYIVKPGALRIVMKRDTLVEFDRDKLSQLNYVIASKLLAPYVYDKTKLIKVTL